MYCASAGLVAVKGVREIELLRERERMPEDIWGLRDDITGPLLCKVRQPNMIMACWVTRVVWAHQYQYRVSLSIRGPTVLQFRPSLL